MITIHLVPEKKYTFYTTKNWHHAEIKYPSDSNLAEAFDAIISNSSSSAWANQTKFL